jgi:hypothetical protein
MRGLSLGLARPEAQPDPCRQSRNSLTDASAMQVRRDAGSFPLGGRHDQRFHVRHQPGQLPLLLRHRPIQSQPTY